MYLKQESKDDFLLSDQFISTAALKIKTNFFELSNRYIGLKETLILIPLSSKYYIIYWNTENNFFCSADTINMLKNEEIELINGVIINNSYNKCIARKKENLEKSLKLYQYASPTHIYGGGGPQGHFMGSIKKKEVFLYQEEKDVWKMFEHMTFTIYKNLSTYDMCACDSGKKFKWCHQNVYRKVQSLMQTFGQSSRENMKEYFIHGITTIEKPIDMWGGYTDEKP